MDKIYFSKIMDADMWFEERVYWFPHAESFAKTRYGWPVLKRYIAFRIMWLEGRLTWR